MKLEHILLSYLNDSKRPVLLLTAEAKSTHMNLKTCTEKIELYISSVLNRQYTKHIECIKF
jgi:hypothetical protein